jgi:excisionase family DNA binding protein
MQYWLQRSDEGWTMKPLRAHDYQATAPPFDAPILIDINELSRRISVPKGTLYNLVYLRRIPFVKMGRSLRFDPKAVIQSLPHFDMIGSAGQGWKGR